MSLRSRTPRSFVAPRIVETRMQPAVKVDCWLTAERERLYIYD